jgi:hypothetical protein
MHGVRLLILFFAFFMAKAANSQDSSVTSQISSKYFETVSKKANTLQEQLDKKSQKVLASMQKEEARLRRRLARIDSLAANNIFSNSATKYRQLQEKLNNPTRYSQYLPQLDTLGTSLRFLEKNPQWLKDIGNTKDKLVNASQKLKTLEGKLQNAEEIKKFIKERKQYLKDQLEKFGFVKKLKRINKDVYYFSQQINEYKEILKDSKKAERKAIELLSKTKLFQDFMKKNSVLASLFRMPSDPNDPANSSILSGLQTRSQVTALIQNQIGTGGTSGQQVFQQNIQRAQSELNRIKNKIIKMGDSGGNGEMPDGFQPNDQKTKGFFKRLEFGGNFQSQKARSVFPVTSDIGVSVGYKLNGKSIIGIGVSYKMGWGSGFNNIRFTHQGVGIRSFIDWKIKGSLWVGGGFEQNFQSEIRSIPQLNGHTGWQQSGLIGISKVISTNKKFLKKTKLQLLWDLLSYQQVPQSQALLFRVGCNF